MIPAADRSVAEANEVPPPTRGARIAAYVAAASALIGFIPLHLVWALGIPLFADEARFRVWFEDGGALYLFVLNAMAVLPAVLAIALVRPWGLVFPRWVPFEAGRRVPRLMLVIPGYAVSALLTLYMIYAIVLTFVQFDNPNAIFSRWIGAFGIPQFAVWSVSLYLATRSYAIRTAAARTRPDR